MFRTAGDGDASNSNAPAAAPAPPPAVRTRASARRKGAAAASCLSETGGGADGEDSGREMPRPMPPGNPTGAHRKYIDLNNHVASVPGVGCRDAGAGHIAAAVFAGVDERGCNGGDNGFGRPAVPGSPTSSAASQDSSNSKSSFKLKIKPLATAAVSSRPG